MHGHAEGGNRHVEWRRSVVEFLKGDSLMVNFLTRAIGRARRLWIMMAGKDGLDGYGRLNSAEIGDLRSVETMNRNLVALSKRAMPNISVVDGFLAMHREGPRHGTPIRLRTVVAGVDAVAVDAVSAAVMGFDPMQVGYLRYAQSVGLGVADPTRIAIVGDPIASVARQCVPHSNHAFQRHWDKFPGVPVVPGGESVVLTPHSRPARYSTEATRR